MEERSIFDENANVVLPYARLSKMGADLFKRDIYSNTARKLNVALALKDDNDKLISSADYWVEFKQSACKESDGVCADSCSMLAREASDFSCAGDRECCVSPVIFKNGRQVPTSCADYDGFCSDSCQYGETAIPYYLLGCEEGTICCVSTTPDDSCPGVCASDCSIIYEDIGRSDCPSGNTCCAD